MSLLYRVKQIQILFIIYFLNFLFFLENQINDYSYRYIPANTFFKSKIKKSQLLHSSLQYKMPLLHALFVNNHNTYLSSSSFITYQKSISQVGTAEYLTSVSHAITCMYYVLVGDINAVSRILTFSGIPTKRFRVLAIVRVHLWIAVEKHIKYA